MDKDKVQRTLMQQKIHRGSWLEYLLEARYSKASDIKEEIDIRIKMYEDCDDLTADECGYLAALKAVVSAELHPSD